MKISVRVLVTVYLLVLVGLAAMLAEADKPGVKLAGADKWKMPCPAGNAYC